METKSIESTLNEGDTENQKLKLKPVPNKHVSMLINDRDFRYNNPNVHSSFSSFSSFSSWTAAPFFPTEVEEPENKV